MPKLIARNFPKSYFNSLLKIQTRQCRQDARKLAPDA
jgi:hypothetical protein